MGGAFVARADDPSAIYFNPAGLASQTGINILAGGNLIMPSTNFTPLGSSTKYSTESQVFTPINLYGTYKIDDKFVVGLGIFNPFGLGTKWPSTFASLTTSLTTWYINPSVGYKIDDQWSVGLGISYVAASLKSTASTPTSLDGTGSGFSVDIGAMYKPMDNLSIGLSFRTGTDIDLSGNFSAMGYGNVTAKETMPMPGNLYIGAAYQLQPELTVEGDIQYVLWSVYKGLPITLTPALPYGPSQNADNRPIKWDDGILLRGGAEYKYSPEITLRGGLILDLSPQPPSNTDFLLPDGDRFDISLGGSYKIDNNWHVDAAYMLVLFMKRDASTGNSAAAAPYTGVHIIAQHM